MPVINPWVAIIAQYGLQFALELKQIIDQKGEPTAQDFIDLIKKYGTETMEQKLIRLAATVPQ